MESLTIWEWLVRLLIAALLGALVGIEREIRGHAAGIRTQAIVSLAAALFTAVGATAFAGAAADPTRIASQVATGIGFIGAGVILVDRGHIRGLTTAATLWLSAALGIAVGVGVIVPATIATVLALGLIHGLRFIKPRIPDLRSRTVRVEYARGHGTIGPLIRSLQALGATIEDLEVDDEAGSTGRTVTIRIWCHDDAGLERALEAMAERPEVHSARLSD